ncbi:MAG: S8 family peptidase [Saprospiraceae bacterium]|nr:S8 family peptidase [Saprospiraceae bacterium]
MGGSLLAQPESAPDNWFNLDPTEDGVRGVSTERVYQELLRGRTGETVIVAVIDSGVDYDHEDLKDIMWVNAGEIAGNGIDDDGNGYIDDVNGWNFIGGAKGNVAEDTYEITRLYKMYQDRFDGVNRDDLSKKEKVEYDQYMEIKKTIDEQRDEMEGNVAFYSGLLDKLGKLKEALGKEDIKAADLEGYEPTDPDLTQAVAILNNVLSQGTTLPEVEEQLKGGVEYFSNSLNYGYNPDFNPRNIVGDNYNDVYERYYGNNDVQGPDASHGTHVSGIIGAVRGNGIGMDGVANNVRIMSVRAVPDGDERDKDVANAIIYAVDNGASVINMSFGKGYAWDKEAVEKAIKYAAKHDVLLVHAAGNSSQDNDNTDNFPNDTYKKGRKTFDNWIEVGALSWNGGPASFSNYGQGGVDLFAPGVDIYSTIPESDYASFSGTSMASPVTAGVAALVRSYYPDLSAKQVREILMASVDPLNEDVTLPGSDETVPFRQLSVTGGVVNAFNAVEMAAETKGKAKKKTRIKDGRTADEAPNKKDRA